MLATVLRAGRVLALFDAAHPEWSVSEVAEALHLPRSTVHALLKTLCGAGLLRKTSSRRYALGPRLHALASHLAAAEPAVVRAQQAAEELVSRWGGTARVVVGDPYWQTAEIFRADGPDGDPRPAGFPHRCLAVVRALRIPAAAAWARDLEESRRGWCCVAAPVRGSEEALVVDLCLPSVVFYGYASRIRASLLSACGHRTGSPSPALPLRALRAGQLTR